MASGRQRQIAPGIFAYDGPLPYVANATEGFFTSSDLFKGKVKPMTELSQRERQGAATPSETCEQRNMRMGWGCKCHGMTFCPDLKFSHYEDDQPVFKSRSGI